MGTSYYPDCPIEPGDHPAVAHTHWGGQGVGMVLTVGPKVPDMDTVLIDEYGRPTRYRDLFEKAGRIDHSERPLG